MSKCYAQHTTHQQCIFETFSRINNSRQSKNGVGAGTKCQSAAQMIQFPNNSSTLTLDCRNSSGKVGKTKNKLSLSSDLISEFRLQTSTNRDRIQGLACKSYPKQMWYTINYVKDLFLIRK